jgi:hypothetical protein
MRRGRIDDLDVLEFAHILRIDPTAVAEQPWVKAVRSIERR